MTGSATQGRLPNCPRCGYDLRGEIATWADACPLAGTCTECGLEFQWAEVLSPAMRLPPWCVEFGRRQQFVWRSWQTAWLTFRPLGFWRSLKMSHDIHWRRVAAYAVFVAAACYAVFCVGHAATAYSRIGPGAKWVLFAPSGVRTAQYTVSWPDYVGVALLPLSSHRIGGIGPSPLRLFKDTWMVDATILVMLLVVHLLCAAGFAALPDSRRAAKVRWAHIHRITVYGLGLFVPAVLLTIAGRALDAQSMNDLSVCGGIVVALASICWVLLVPAEVVWWSAATGRYLRMPHAWGVGLSVVVMAVLAVTTLSAYLALANQ